MGASRVNWQYIAQVDYRNPCPYKPLGKINKSKSYQHAMVIDALVLDSSH
jgi:hypothetical protein